MCNAPVMLIVLYRVLKCELSAEEFAMSIEGKTCCCDDTASTAKIQRHFRKVEMSGGDRNQSEVSLVAALVTACKGHSSKGGSETRHLEALFSMMRMLGLRPLYTQFPCKFTNRRVN